MPNSTVLAARPFAANWLHRLSALLVLLPIGCYTTLLLAYAVNVPWLDDVDAFMTFMLGFSDATTPGEKLNWLLRPNNEHRILTAKLVTVTMQMLTGEVNFRWLIMVAFGFLGGTFALLYRVFQTMRLPLLAFAPVCFIFWQPQYYLTSLWALTGLQHEVVLFLVLAAIYLLSVGSRGAFTGGLALQVLASLSMSNGLFGWVAGAVVLGLARQWRRLGGWLVLGGATGVFYFHDFPNAQGNGSSLLFLVQHPHIVTAAFFTFTGALLDFFPSFDLFRRSLLPTAFGVLLVAAVGWLLYQMYWPVWVSDAVSRGPSRRGPAAIRRSFFTGCYAFLFVNALTIAVLRPRFGYDVMLVSNYMIYPAVLVSIVYLNGLSELRSLARSRWLRSGLALGGVVWTVSYSLHWTQIAFRKQTLLTYAFNQKHNAIGLGPTWGSPFAAMVRRDMQESVGRGLYHYPTGYLTPFEPLLTPAAGPPARPTVALHVGQERENTLVVTAPGALTRPVGQAVVVVRSDRGTYLFPSALAYQPGAFYLGRPVRAVQAEVVKPMLAPGTYQVGILTPSDPEHPLRFSDQWIQVPQ